MSEAGGESIESASLWGSSDQRLDYIIDMMRQLSRLDDPQQMVQMYTRRVRRMMPADGVLSLSRRGLDRPHYRITRTHLWGPDHNPWKNPDRMPVLGRGILGQLIHDEMPRVIDQLEISPDDPAEEFFRGFASLWAVPLFDQGKALNMVVLLRREPHAFRDDLPRMPEHVWISNLFGLATHSLVLGREVKQAYDVVDRELKVVADIQRSLLPRQLPAIPGLDLAVHYLTSRRAGGDYYDFFELPDGRWGILVADVSGHGTPAAVIMAVTHSIAHTLHEAPEPPSKLLTFVNQHLTRRYTNGNGTFVTAFYGIYDPQHRVLTYANAGHNPPRHRRAGATHLKELEGATNLPLGIDADEIYLDFTERFAPGDTVVFYTDGITEARRPDNEMFGLRRLDEAVLGSRPRADEIVREVIASVDRFVCGRVASDDQTLLIAAVR